MLADDYNVGYKLGMCCFSLSWSKWFPLSSVLVAGVVSGHRRRICIAHPVAEWPMRDSPGRRRSSSDAVGLVGLHWPLDR